MKSKKKFIIAISSLVVVVAIIVVALVTILAVPNADVEPKFKVKYTATDVSATVRANTIVGSTRTSMKTTLGEEEIVFTATDEEQTSILLPQDEDIALSVENKSVVFEYIFTNNSNSVDVAVFLERDLYSENISVKYSFSYTQVEDVDDLPLTTTFAPMMILGEEKEEGAFNSLYVYIKVSVVNLANDADFEGGLCFGLLEDEPVKLNFENVENATNASLFDTWLVPKSYVGSESDYMGYAFGLPQPSFETGACTWYTDEALTTKLDYPFSFDEDTTIYAGTTDYTIEFLSEFAVFDDASYSVINDGVFMVYIENTSNDKIYIKSDYVDMFMYSKNFDMDYDWLLDVGENGNATNCSVSTFHNVFNNEYLILNSGEKIVMDVNSDAKFYGLLETVSNGGKFFEQFGVTKTQPEDISTKLFYASYGAYPQTYVGDSLNNELRSASSSELVATGKTYTTDLGSWTNDEDIDCGYGTPGVHTATLVEYTYKGKTIAKLDSAKTFKEFAGEQGCYYFNNASEAENGATYFFYVEPILTKAMQKNDNGTYTVQTCDVIGSMAFNKYGAEEEADNWDNSWENSEIRAYLNGAFLSESGLADVVVETTISNTDYWNTCDYEADTTDKIWLASFDEMLKWLGLTEEEIISVLVNRFYSVSNDLTIPQISDMALASYGYKTKTVSNNSIETSAFWLRSPGLSADLVGGVSGSDVLGSGYEYCFAIVGFCPAFAINL